MTKTVIKTKVWAWGERGRIIDLALRPYAGKEVMVTVDDGKEETQQPVQATTPEGA